MHRLPLSIYSYLFVDAQLQLLKCYPGNQYLRGAQNHPNEVNKIQTMSYNNYVQALSLIIINSTNPQPSLKEQLLKLLYQHT